MNIPGSSLFDSVARIFSGARRMAPALVPSATAVLLALGSHSAHSADRYKQWVVSDTRAVVAMETASGPNRFRLHLFRKEECAYRAQLRIPSWDSDTLPTITADIDGRAVTWPAELFFELNGERWVALDASKATTDTIERVRNGQVLTFTVDRERYRFSLAGSAAAISAGINKCRPPRKKDPQIGGGKRLSQQCDDLISRYYNYCENAFLSRPHPSCGSVVNEIRRSCPRVARALSL